MNRCFSPVFSRSSRSAGVMAAMVLASRTTPADIVLDVGLLLGGEGLPVGLLQHIPDDAAHFLQVPALCLPVHVVLGPEELGVGEFHLCHYLVPPFFWMRLISRDSTKAWTRVRSWPELPLLYRRSILSTGQSYSSCMMWLTSARSKPVHPQSSSAVRHCHIPA